MPLVAGDDEIDRRGFATRPKLVVLWIWQTGAERLRIVDLLALGS